MYSIGRRVGRLVEIAICSPGSLDEAARWGRDHDDLVASIAGDYVCFVDLRGATVFPPDIVDAYVSTMKTEARLARTGTLVGDGATQGLQAERMVREARHPGRRAFRDPARLVEWLGQVLTVAERGRLHDVAFPARQRSMSSANPWTAQPARKGGSTAQDKARRSSP